MIPTSVSAFNLTSASYDDVFFSFTNETTGAYDIFFASNGSILYMKSLSNKNIFQYTLSTPYDLSTASYANIVSDSPGDVLNVEGFQVSKDGTKVYIYGSNASGIHQYTLTTPFDMSTFTSTSTATVFNTERNLVTSSEFSSDGTKLYTTSSFIDEVYQYTLSTPFDVSTASFDNLTFYYGDQEDQAKNIVFNTDGTNMFINGSDSERLYQYTLTTPFDISTASYNNVSLDLTTESGGPSSVFFNDDYSKMYVMGRDNDNVYQYSLDQIDPEITTLFPDDNAINVSINTDLILTFSESIDTEAGNITIAKVSDDTIVEVIDSAGAKVSATDTNEITINAATTLDYSTEYYVLIDATAFDDSNSNSFAGISGTSTWNFTTRDEPQESEDEDEDDNSRRTGTSLSRRILNLEEMGKYDKAQELRDRFNIREDKEDSSELSLLLVIQTLIRIGIIPEDQAQTALNMTEDNGNNDYVFTKDLELNDIDEDVRVLQKYLNNNGFLVAQTGPGSLGNETNIFGSLTQSALIEFQNTNSNEILMSVGLTSGTGYFGQSTRNFVNN